VDNVADLVVLAETSSTMKISPLAIDVLAVPIEVSSFIFLARSTIYYASLRIVSSASVERFPPIATSVSY
jgi:hypothetical protein